MAWARLDDAYYDNPKMLAVGLAGTGLHARAISYSSRHGLDGKVPASWVEQQLIELRPADRRRVLDALVQHGAFTRENGGYRIKDFLEFNPPAEELAKRREARSEAGRLGAHARWHRP